MVRLGGFEASPRLAVGVSGGADSLALALLAHGWATERGGSVLALTVDHGLRAESAGEAARVAAWMAGRGIPHAVLRWDGGKPATGIQAAARDARRRLLAERCRAEGILHLALAHHADDQAETVLLRLARGSGVDGLAGMAPVRWDRHVRLIRPLIDVPHARLVATCRAMGQDWIEDPSNRSPTYARGRLRAVADALGAEGLSTDRLCDTARRAARARNALETLTADLLARAAHLYPEGWIRLDPVAVAAAPEELGQRALARALACVGGAPYPPRAERLERLYGEIRAGLSTGWMSGGRMKGGRMKGGWTLGGCRLLPRRGALLVVRESEAAGERTVVAPGGEVWWDNRFRVRLGQEAPEPLTVARLGPQGWRTALAEWPDLARLGLPEPVRSALPGLWNRAALAAVPGLAPAPFPALARFVPAYPLAGPAFPVVSGSVGII